MDLAVDDRRGQVKLTGHPCTRETQCAHPSGTCGRTGEQENGDHRPSHLPLGAPRTPVARVVISRDTRPQVQHVAGPEGRPQTALGSSPVNGRGRSVGLWAAGHAFLYRNPSAHARCRATTVMTSSLSRAGQRPEAAAVALILEIISRAPGRMAVGGVCSGLGSGAVFGLGVCRLPRRGGLGCQHRGPLQDVRSRVDGVGHTIPVVQVCGAGFQGGAHAGGA